MENDLVNLSGALKLTPYDSETCYSIEKEYSAEDIIELKLNNISEHVLKKVIEYLEHYKGTQPALISVPLLGVTLDNIYEEEFDKTFVKELGKKDLLEIANAASYLENEYLKKTCCAMIAKEIRGKGPEEVAAMLEEYM